MTNSANTPQLDSEELRKDVISLLDSLTFNVIKWKYGASSAETRAEQFKCAQEIMQLIQTDRAAFADRVLAVVPEKFSDIQIDGMLEGSIGKALVWNQAIDQVTAAITNLVAEERGEKKG